MQAEFLFWVGLLAADVLILAAAGIGYVAFRKLRPVTVVDLRTAFEVLDRSIEKYVPGVPRGYTWNEAFELLRGKGVKADWDKMGSTLSEYEAYRYGGREAPTKGHEDVVSLALRLGRGMSGEGTKEESSRPG